MLSLECSTFRVTIKTAPHGHLQRRLHIAPATNERNLYNWEAREDLGHAILDHGFRMKGLDIKMDGSLDVDFNL